MCSFMYRIGQIFRKTNVSLNHNWQTNINNNNNKNNKKKTNSFISESAEGHPHNLIITNNLN